MAITVGEGVLEQQARKTKLIRHRILYRRRFWDVDTQAYKLEASQTEVLQSDENAVSSTREALDRKGINRFESSNITIELHNQGNIWNPLNQDGLFAADDTAKLGYEQQLMEFSVEAIYELEDGTEAPAIPIFTEGRATKFINRPDQDIVVITVESKNILLKRSDAENVSDAVVNAGLVGTVDGVNTTFTSPDLGVGRVDAVREGTSPRTLGSQVKISDLNNPDVGATFEFDVAPVVQAFADYIFWKQDQPIETLVDLLVAEAGIDVADREITPVTFPSQVLNKESFTTQPDWDSGTLVNIDSVSRPGDILSFDLGGAGLIDDFEDGDFSSNPTWTVVAGTWIVQVNVGSQRLTSNNVNSTLLNEITTPFTGLGGTWQWEHSYTGVVNSIPFVAAAGTPVPGTKFTFMEDTATVTSYEIHYRTPTAFGVHAISLNRVVGAATSTVATTTITNAAYVRNFAHAWRVTLDQATGEFKIYIDGILRLTHTEPLGQLLSVVDIMRIRADSSVGGGQVQDFDNIAHIGSVLPPPNAVADVSTWESPVIDTGGGNPASYGLLDHIDIIPPGTTLLYETRTSDDGFGFDPYVAIGGTDLIISAVKQFIQVRITLTTDATKTLTPIISSIAVNFITASTTIRLANFTKLSVFTAVGILAQIANFEWGISRQSKFFFRPRTFKKTPDHIITLRDLTSFSRIEDGVERVFNLIRGDYGNHRKSASPVTRNDPSPNSFDRFGVKTLDVGSTQLLLDPDADIATGLTISYFQEFKNPRRVYELEIDFRPQIELADAMLLRILDFLPDPPWHIGDSSRAIGDTDINLFGAEQQAACEVLARVLSVRHNVNTKKTALELEEVI